MKNASRLHSLLAALLALSPAAFAADIPTDRVIVRLKGGAPALTKGVYERAAIAKRLSDRSGESLQALRVMGDGAQVMQMSRRMTTNEIRSRFGEIKDNEILEIVPDRIFTPALTPNDSRFAEQWNLTAATGINMPAAWDVSTGAASRVIAIVDTGKLPHDELATRWVGGYDFVSLSARENDGTAGRDADASDPGDWITSAENASGGLAGCPVTDSRWHGTAMAGVIGAAGNNGTGIAGINWQSKLLPVRVVGKCGGYESDIADGIRWSAGVAVPSVPGNANVAHVINVSLSAPGACSGTLQSAINEAVAAGAPVIAAAGNNTLDASGFSPGNCANAITVGAVDRNGGKAGYTNFGATVILSAPGGKSAEHFGGSDTTANQWVLTTSNQGITGPSGINSFFRNEPAGTSIAAAQVTGIVSLMLSANPVLAPQFVTEILRETARAFPTATPTSGSQADCTKALCGAGIANAAHAVATSSRWGTAQPQVAGSYEGALGVTSDGRVYAWAYSQLPTLGALNGVVAIAAGWDHSVALRADGSVWAWGSNYSGQLGEGPPALVDAPLKVTGVNSVTQVAAGRNHTLALRSDGTVWAWGENYSGQLGDGTLASRTLPVQVAGLSNVIYVAAGLAHSLAVKSDGTVWAWGFNDHHQLGMGGAGSGGADQRTPVQVIGVSNATRVAATASQSVALRSDGTVWSWGKNLTVTTSTATQVPGLSGITRLAGAHSSGRGHLLALKSDGTVWAWADNDFGQLGDGTQTNRSAPQQVAGLSNVSEIGVGLSISMAVRADGAVYWWGGISGSATPVPVGMGGSSLNLVTSPSSFTPLVNMPISSLRESNVIVPTGIPAGSAISVTGGEYRIGSGLYTSAPGTINSGQSVQVRQTSSSTCETAATTTLTIAGVARPFTVTTEACVTDAWSFDFLTVVNVPPGSTQTSNAVAVGRITAPSPVEVTGGQYSINCTATFTSAPGTIAPGQSVCVRAVASASYNTAVTVSLRIGAGFPARFHVVTQSPPGFTTSAQIAAGNRSVAALTPDGRVHYWYTYTSQQTAIFFPMTGAVAIAGGLVARADGTVWALATNNGGAAQIPGLTGIVQLASSSHHLALRNDGTVWAWGENAYGQLGDGSTTERSTPVQVLGLTNVVHVAVGSAHSLAVRSDGTVWSWGYNYEHQLGDGANPSVPGVQRTTPAQVAGIANATRVAATGGQSLALTSGGTVFWWGRGGTITSSPAAVPLLAGVTRIAAGGGRMLALKADGTVWAWGSDFNDVFDAVVAYRSNPVQVTGLAAVQEIAAGSNHYVVLLVDGSIFWWGEIGPDRPAGLSTVVPLPTLVTDASGNAIFLFGGTTRPHPFAFLPAFGVATSTPVASTPVTVSGLGQGISATASVSGGEMSVNGGAFTTAAASVVNGSTIAVRVVSAPGFSTTTSATVTVGGVSGSYSSSFYVRTGGDVAAKVVPLVAAGDSHTYLLTSAGLVYAAGYNGNGQLGNGSTLGSSTLRPVAGLADVVSIASGAFHGLALRRDGTVAAWGSNAVGQLGHGSTNASERNFVNVASLGGVAAIAAGRYHSMALRSNGTISTWGLNADGQLGDGSTTSRLAPVQVTGLAGVTAVAAGGRHSLALLADGTVRAWGANDQGQLGDGTTTARLAPVAVGGLTGVIAIAAGDSHSLALKNNGAVVAWGFNAFGQLGDNTTTTRLTPVSVAGLASGVGIIVAGANHSMAVRLGGVHYTWGNNANSQIGNSANTNRLIPLQLVNPANVVSVAGGARHTAAIVSSRRLYVWGDNFFGQVGNRSGNYNPHSSTLNVLRGDSVISSGTSFSGSGIGTGSNSGSAVLEVDGQSAGFDFGTRAAGTSSSVAGRYANSSALEQIKAVGLSVTGSGFSLSGSDCPSELSPGAQCNFTVGFNAAGTGTYYGELLVQSSVVGSPERRSLVGTATAPSTAAIAFGRAGELFAPQDVGFASAPARHPITNTGSGPLTVTGLSSGLADYTATHNCVGVAPGGSCTVEIEFKPTATGSRTTQITVSSNASGSPHTVTVFGTGVGSGPNNPARLFNIATRGPVLTGDNVMIAGFIIGGTAPKTVLVRARGPSLAQFGVPGVLQNPQMQLYSGQTVIASNDNWGDATNKAAMEITGFAPENAQESAILTTLAPGGYTSIVSGVGNTTGIGIVEVFEVGEATTGLHNIATRGQTQTGDNVMIAGFIIQGDGPQTVLIRARGPSLSQFGVPGVLANPKLDLYSGQTVIASNDNWGDSPDKAAIQASGNAPGDPNEAAILTTLQPGGYTAIVTGVGGGTGVAIVEVFRN